MKKNVGISYKAFAVILAAVLILGGAIGGTMAWLIDGTEAVANVFTDSDINITLVEEAKSKPDAFKMIPGHTITKDPKVTVKSGSEDCYLFVKIDKSANYDKYLAQYAVDISKGAWIKLDKDNAGNALEGVYYREVSTSGEDQEFSILTGGSIGEEGEGDGVFEWGPNQVLVKPSVTKANMDAIDGVVENGDEEAINAELANRPTLTFTAYAVQRNKTNNTPFTPVEAWAKAQGIPNNAN